MFIFISPFARVRTTAGQKWAPLAACLSPGEVFPEKPPAAHPCSWLPRESSKGWFHPGQASPAAPLGRGGLSAPRTQPFPTCLGQRWDVPYRNEWEHHAAICKSTLLPGNFSILQITFKFKNSLVWGSRIESTHAHKKRKRSLESYALGSRGHGLPVATEHLQRGRGIPW